MELFNNLVFGFGVALSLQNLLYCLIGCLVGTLIGVLPGIGPMATIAMLLPLTYNVPPVAAMIMLAGIYYGAMYGGSPTSILSSPASTVTRWRSRGGPARRSQSLPAALSLPAPCAR
jgi:TctA family transporter